MNKRKSITTTAILAAAACALVGCTSVSTEPDQTALQYEGGSFSSKKYGTIVGPSTREMFGMSDTVYVYPMGQRAYDATGGDKAERGPFTSASKDGVELATPLSITFELKVDEASLRKFHELIGIKYKAYYDGDGEDVSDPSGVSAGWRSMLDFYVGQSLDATVDRIIATYAWRDAYGDAAIRTKIEDAIKADLPAIVNSKMQGTFLENYAVQVQRPVPTNAELLKAIADAQNNIALSEAAKAKATADKETAQAQVAVAQAEAQKRKAEISAYGSVDEYNRAQAIEKGINPYQPTYIVPGTAPGNK